MHDFLLTIKWNGRPTPKEYSVAADTQFDAFVITEAEMKARGVYGKIIKIMQL